MPKFSRFLSVFFYVERKLLPGVTCILAWGLATGVPIPEHPAPASLLGLSRLTHHQTQFSISRLIVIILHYVLRGGGEQNRYLRLSRTSRPSIWGRI